MWTLIVGSLISQRTWTLCTCCDSTVVRCAEAHAQKHSAPLLIITIIGPAYAPANAECTSTSCLVRILHTTGWMLGITKNNDDNNISRSVQRNRKTKKMLVGLMFERLLSASNDLYSCEVFEMSWQTWLPPHHPGRPTPPSKHRGRKHKLDPLVQGRERELRQLAALYMWQANKWPSRTSVFYRTEAKCFFFAFCVEKMVLFISNAHTCTY